MIFKNCYALINPTLNIFFYSSLQMPRIRGESMVRMILAAICKLSVLGKGKLKREAYALHLRHAFNKTGALLNRHIRQINLPRCTRQRSLPSRTYTGDVENTRRHQQTPSTIIHCGSNGSRENLERSLTGDIGAQ